MTAVSTVLCLSVGTVNCKLQQFYFRYFKQKPKVVFVQERAANYPYSVISFCQSRSLSLPASLGSCSSSTTQALTCNEKHMVVLSYVHWPSLNSTQISFLTTIDHPHIHTHLAQDKIAYMNTWCFEKKCHVRSIMLVFSMKLTFQPNGGSDIPSGILVLIYTTADSSKGPMEYAIPLCLAPSSLYYCTVTKG